MLLVKTLVLSQTASLIIVETSSKITFYRIIGTIVVTMQHLTSILSFSRMWYV